MKQETRSSPLYAVATHDCPCPVPGVFHLSDGARSGQSLDEHHMVPLVCDHYITSSGLSYLVCSGHQRLGMLPFKAYNIHMMQYTTDALRFFEADDRGRATRPYLIRMESSRIIVKNLPKWINEDRLRKHFAAKGQITDVRMMYTRSGVFRRFAYIGFGNVTEASSAVKYFDRSFIDTSRISVEFAQKVSQFAFLVKVVDWK